mmetsp:Transcript_25787/g.62613  ORF Transcript_25787/g.62613 Transcript_25787/m.62613 type:complete len:241 (-) Transcript_25787:169-891(-)
MVSSTIVADQSRSVQNKPDRQLLKSNVVYDLVVATLQKGRVDAAKRPETLRGHARGHGDRVLLGNTDVKATRREALAKEIEARATRHSSSDGHNFAVAVSVLNERFGKDGGVGRRLCGGLCLFARGDIKLGNTVVLVKGCLGGRVPAALFGLDMYKDGLVARHVADIFEDCHQRVNVVAVDRANIVKAELLKDGSLALGHNGAGILVHLGGHAFDFGGEERCKLLCGVAKVQKRTRRDQP